MANLILDPFYTEGNEASKRLSRICPCQAFNETVDSPQRVGADVDTSVVEDQLQG